MINGWRKRYPITVFPSLWETLAVLMDEGVVFSCDEVYGELKRQKDELLEWAKGRRGAFERPTEEVLSQLATVMSRFPNFAAQGGSGNHADPFVIAHAQVADAVVVTDEEWAERQRPTKPPKIPNVCEELGIPWMSPAEFLAAIGITL